jgi:hypothetical protein
VLEGTHRLLSGSIGTDDRLARRSAAGSSTPSGQGKIYGEADPALTYTVTAGSIVAGDGFSGLLVRLAGEDLGSYPIMQGTLAFNANYLLTYISASFVITPRATPAPPQADSQSLPSYLLPATNIWAVVTGQRAWLAGQIGEALSAGSGYVETAPGEGFRFCNPAALVTELARGGRAQLSGPKLVCGF